MSYQFVEIWDEVGWCHKDLTALRIDARSLKCAPPIAATPVSKDAEIFAGNSREFSEPRKRLVVQEQVFADEFEACQARCILAVCDGEDG
jgi:hypothetical protein